MATIWAALTELEDEAARNRCINWALSRLGINVSTGPTRGASGASPVVHSRTASVAPTVDAGKALNFTPGPNEWDDVFEQSEDGSIRVIARDLKAKSRNDAAIRLVHLIVYANEVLNGQTKTSSKKLVLPVLREWRAYDPNVRGAIANHQGIKRDGDLLSLDIHSKRDAATYIEQIRDESTKGSWSPVASKSKKTSKKKGQESEA